MTNLTAPHTRGAHQRRSAHHQPSSALHQAFNRAAPGRAVLATVALAGMGMVVPPAQAACPELGSHDSPAQPLQTLPGNPECITHRAQARYGGLGYDHLVHIDNGCQRTALCKVSTNVNPKVLHATVDAGKTKTVVTFRGSPAREFEAKVACKLR